MVHLLRFFQSSRRWLKFSFLAISILMLCLISTPLIAQSVSLQELVQQGKQFYETGQFEQALTHWEQATAAYQKQQDTVGMSGSLINQAQALSALGLQRRACKTLVQALKLNDADNDRLCDPVFYDKQVFQPDLSDPLLVNVQATGLRSLGNVLRLIGNLEASQAVLEQSLKTAPKDAKADILVSLGNTLRDLGNRDRDRTDKIGQIRAATAATKCLANRTGSDTAIDYYNQAINCYQEAATTASNPFTTLQAQSNHLALLVNIEQWLYQNNPVKAIQWNAQTRSQTTSLITNLSPLIERLPATYEGIFTRINFARSLGMQPKQNKLAGNNPAWQVASSASISAPPAEDWNTAKQLLDQAWQQAQALKNIRASSSAAGNLGWLYEQSEQWDEALLWTRTGLRRAKQLVSADLIYQWEWQTGRILKQQGKVKDAIASYDQAVTALQATRGDLVAVNPDAQFSLRDTAEPIYRELIDLILQPANPDQAALKKAVELIDFLRLAELEDFLRCRLAEVKTVKVDQIDDPTAAIFYPIVLRDRIEIILKLPNQANLVHYRSNVTRRDLNQQIQLFKEQLETTQSGADVKVSAKTVYGWVLKDAESYLESAKIKTLVFVPDGLLRDIPISSLHDGQKYLIEKYAIAVTPGLEILGPKQLAPRKLNALIAGLSIERKITVNGKPHKFDALKNVTSEIQQIKTTLKRATTLADQEFTTQALQAQTTETSYPFVHLATHGQFSSNLEDTFILTASDQPMSVNQLQALLQVRNQRQTVPVELLVLSACETAAGDRRATLGLAGIAVRAGALGTLASLWVVSDESTAALMGQFYGKLVETSQAPNKAEALRQAQLLLLQDSEYNHPYYWSPFVLVGNWL